MRLIQYYNEFFDNKYLRDFRFIGKTNKTCHAPKTPSTKIKQTKKARRFILKAHSNKISKYYRFYGGLSYYDSMIDYQLANEDAKMVNHIFLDIDAPIKIDSEFRDYTHKQEDAKRDLTGKEYMDKMDYYQEKIQDLIFNTNLLKESWNKSKRMDEYFTKQGLTTYNCFSSSKGFHTRLFFKPIHLNNYNHIIHSLHKGLVEKLDLQGILDDQVTGKDSNPISSVERLPYSYNEKSGLRVTPFEFGVDSFDDVLETSLKLAKHNKLTNVDDFFLDDYTNKDFHNSLKKIDVQLDVLNEKENTAKEKLMKEQIANGTVNGKYIGNTGLFKDLRTLVRFICGDTNLVSEHERYNKYKCFFHDDKSPSCIVGKKNYTCLSSNCKINKLNYFGFIKEWFKLESDDEVKGKMVELQQEYYQQLENVESENGVGATVN